MGEKCSLFKREREVNGQSGMRKTEGIKRQSQTEDRRPDHLRT